MTDKYFSAGAIYWGQFTFHDGMHEKYVVLLNDCIDPSDYFVVAFVTSQPRYRGETSKQCGSPTLPCYRIEVGQVACFKKTTWVQFDNLFPPGGKMERQVFVDYVKNGKLRYQQHLPEDMTRAVLNCAKKSDDLTLEQIGLIEKTLKAQIEAAAKAKLAPSQSKQPSGPTSQHAPPTPSKPDWNKIPDNEVVAEVHVEAELLRNNITVADACDFLNVKSLRAGVRAGDVRSVLALLQEIQKK